MKRITYRIIFVAACIIFAACVIILLGIYLPSCSNSDQYKNTEISNSNEDATDDLPANPIDFNELQSANPDIYAWITIPDTNIDYAVAQASYDKDDLYYLDHDMNGDYDYSGTIFSQKQNTLDFSDPVTVLYGHNMKNGTMFANLHKFEDRDFFEEHDTFYVYTPKHMLTYTVVSAYVYDDRHILNSFDFSDKKDLKEYISEVTNPHSIVSNVRDDVSVTTNDNILTLSTCTSTDSQRYLLQGVLTDDRITK